MFKISKPPSGPALHQTALVAFDRATGRVYGTFVHASLDPEDPGEISRSRERFLKDVASHVRPERVEIEVLHVAMHELPTGSIDRVDPQTRKLVTSPPPRHLPGIPQI
jgi:hypothetical protein